MKILSYKWVFLVCILWVLGANKLMQCSVSYDRKAIVINGERRILISGSIHYPRSTPEMWGDLINKAKIGGLDVVDTYVFWNVHEPSPGNYNFEGRYDLVKFIKTIQQAGLYAHLRIGPYIAHLRIGPYICAEWNFGGFPVWLKYVPGISFRTDNEPFKMHMQRFTEKIVSLMKSEGLFESQGGPIILSQIENEYGPQVKLSGYPAQQYMTWAAKMAVGLNTGVPWVMCKEEDAPDPVINTCNGVYCDAFSPNKPYKPTLWTEAWTGWFTEFGGPIHERPVEDLAFAVAKFFQKGGSFVNYYMFHGGTNFGRSSGGPFITTSYDYDAPLDEYGLIRQPKYGHLKELHKAIKLCEQALISADPTVTSLGNLQQAHVLSSKTGKCAAFLSNYDSETSVKVTFNNMHYSLPPWSISILPDCRNVVFNTAKVEVQASKMEMLPTNSEFFSWGSYNEDLNSLNGGSTFTTSGLLEQINVTRDTTDYLWYSTSVDISPSESCLHGGELPFLIVQSSGHALHVFINGHRIGSYFGKRKKRRFMFKEKIKLQAGRNKIALLSVAVGLPNVGVHYETWKTGVLGPVVLHGLDKGQWDLSLAKWTYKVGLEGETMKNFGFQTATSPTLWTNDGSFIAQQQHPLMWHKAYFNAPDGDEPLALDMSSMGKGQVWINGQNLGRYWTLYGVGNCNKCSYIGPFHSSKCQLGCGQPTQRWYHVPRAWLNPTRNLLVLFEELGGDPTRIMLMKKSVTSVCATVTENHHTVKNWTHENYGKMTQELRSHRPRLRIHCGIGKYISGIKFASFGTPLGSCGSFQKGSCHAMESYNILKKKCLGQQKCSVTISNNNFGQDPCPNVLKRLSVDVICSPA